MQSTTRNSLGFAAMFLLSVPFGGGCADEVGDGVFGAGAQTSSTGNAGGEGGGGGAVAGAGGSACSEDCSLIEAPQCLVAVCNTGQLAGEIGACVVVADENGAACDDDQFCTVNDTCQEGTCVGGEQNDCAMNVPACTTTVCDETSQSCQAVPAEEGVPCFADDLCQTNTTCQAGECKGVAKDCFFSPFSECNDVACNPQNGECEPTPAPNKNGNTCYKVGDQCMTGKTCSDGDCVGGAPKDCSGAASDCTLGLCDQVDGSCYGEPVAPGGPCASATDECNAGSCDINGQCSGTPTPGVACASQTDECNAGSCSAAGICEGAPTVGVACASQTDECNVGSCDASGLCVGNPTVGVACASATDTCNAGACDVSGQCTASPVNNGGACDDGNACTIGDACGAGICAGLPNPGYTVYFSENFASNAQGWTLGPEWEIGPAVAGPAGNCEDPGMDTTPSADNGIAGVAIGACSPSSVANMLHGMYYLESPPFDTTGATALLLDFKRWLESDYTPFMNNVIEVYDGTAWVQIWQSGASPGISDAPNWVPITHDISAYANAQMRVRFGFDIGSTGVFDEGSWSIDDVVVANLSCQ